MNFAPIAEPGAATSNGAGVSHSTLLTPDSAGAVLEADMSDRSKWFAHDADARHDPKLRYVVKRHGPAGYAFYFAIVEAMRERLSVDGISGIDEEPWALEAIAGDVGVDDYGPILETCLACGLLVRDGVRIVSNRFVDECKRINARSESGKKAIAQRWAKNEEKNTPRIRTYYDRNTQLQLQDKNKMTTSQAMSSTESLPAREGSWTIPEEFLATIKDSFPGVDVPAEIRIMRSWLEARASRRKTFSGMKRFVQGWIAREYRKLPKPRPVASVDIEAAIRAKEERERFAAMTDEERAAYADEIAGRE